ncbi:MAG: TonB-dependent receptor plug domain-containing protein, partial [Pseudomonadales bacterium]
TTIKANASQVKLVHFWGIAKHFDAPVTSRINDRQKRYLCTTLFSSQGSCSSYFRVSAAATGTAQTAHSQELMLEEIIVTATKRSANRQDVPLAITAFSTDDIAKRGLVNMDDDSSLVPALSIVRRGPDSNSVVFRGIAASGLQFGTKSSSGVYVYLNEQPITTAGVNPDPNLIDLERLEALSGPQGTLFSEASPSGTLRVITNKPNTEAFSACIDGGAATVKGSDDIAASYFDREWQYDANATDHQAVFQQISDAV